MTRWGARVALVVATAACVWLILTRLTVSSDLSALFPGREKSAALARFTRVFGGGDLGIVLLQGESAADVEAAAHDAAVALATKAAIVRVIERGPAESQASQLDPTLSWRHAGPRARARLAAAMTPDGMRARLAETRALLLAPGSSAAEDMLSRDPLRLSSIPWEEATELAAGVSPSQDGSFVAARGLARLLVLEPRGNAFDPAAARAFVHDVEDALAVVRAHHPAVRSDLTGGHAIAHATEAMLRRDLTVSSVVSMALASIVFLLMFRRARALVAIMPPLMLGTVWTTAIAAVAWHGLSAIAIAFAAVVVGVGVDTGVHVYAALLQGRRQGLAPAHAALFARRTTWKPTLLAATVAGLAFGALALGDLAGMRQLGILCGAGEVLTAIAILLVTPEIGAWLESGPPPPASTPRWLGIVAALTSTRRRALVALALAMVPIVALIVFGGPLRGGALVALRPRALSPLAVYDEIYRVFGGRPGQWIVMSVDRDPSLAASRADAVAEALEPLREEHAIEGFDALASYAPAPATQGARLAARDALDLPARAADLASALASLDFDVEACAPALEALRHPSHATTPLDPAARGPLAWLTTRHLQTDGADTLATTYVRPIGDAAKDARALKAIHAADPAAIVTGFPALEEDLARTLSHDLPRIALVALLIVALGLRAALRRSADVVLALFVLVAELALLGVAMRIFGLHWHVYDALVIPVLIGITLDESLFLLHAAEGESPDTALSSQGPLVAATALTTAAGFGALLMCRFDGLFDLGAVGALGSVMGLLAALVIVPAGLRLARRPVS